MLALKALMNWNQTMLILQIMQFLIQIHIRCLHWSLVWVQRWLLKWKGCEETHVSQTLNKKGWGDKGVMLWRIQEAQSQLISNTKNMNSQSKYNETLSLVIFSKMHLKKDLSCECNTADEKRRRLWKNCSPGSLIAFLSVSYLRPPYVLPVDQVTEPENSRRQQTKISMENYIVAALWEHQGEALLHVTLLVNLLVNLFKHRHLTPEVCGNDFFDPGNGIKLSLPVNIDTRPYIPGTG